MNRESFEHVIHAAVDVVNDDVVVIGSQAILGHHPDAPDSLLKSLEVDLYPRNAPERSAEIDGAIGDGSPFHQTYGYYAHGVGPETPIAPAGWEERLTRIEVRTRGNKSGPVIAWCLEPHDLMLSKLAAGRPHDLEFVETAIRENLVITEQLELGIDLMPEGHREVTSKRLTGLLTRIDRSP